MPKKDDVVKMVEGGELTGEFGMPAPKVLVPKSPKPTKGKETPTPKVKPAVKPSKEK